MTTFREDVSLPGASCSMEGVSSTAITTTAMTATGIAAEVQANSVENEQVIELRQTITKLEDKLD